MNLETQHKNSQNPVRNKFRPINDGLGLNHFKDGLPYSPQSKRLQEINQHKVKTKINFAFPKESFGTMLMKSDIFADANSNSESGVELFISTQNAHFLRRFFAYAIDLSITIALFSLIAWSSFALNGYDLSTMLKGDNGIQVALPLFLLYGVIYMGYFLIQEITWRRTIGKKIFGISIASDSGFSTIARSFLFFLSAIPFGLGLGWYFFDSKRRCWHDLVTESEVILHS